MLIFENIDIRKMPGLDSGLKTYENLSPQINIIAGPNASGKSSTARAIQQLIWHGDAKRVSAKGNFSINNEQWLSEVDSSYAVWQRNGSNAELSGIPSNEDRSRYMLSLHELISKEEKNLAESVLKDAIGGYDIDEARKKLDYRDTKSPKNISQYKTYDEAQKAADKIENNQRKLQQEQQKLAELEEQKEQAKKAENKAEFYKLAKVYKEKNEAVKNVTEQLAGFSEKMEKVKEDDYDDFKTYKRSIQDGEQKLHDAVVDLQEFKEKREALKLPESGINSLDLNKAGEYLEELSDYEQEIREANEKIAVADSERKEAGERLGLEPDKNSFERLTVDDIELTEQLWQNAFQVFGEVNILKTSLKRLEEQKEDSTNSETLRTGISALAEWLKSYGQSGKPVSKLYLGLVFASAIGTAVLAQLFGPVGYVGIIFVALFIFLIYNDQHEGDDSNISVRVSDFKQTGLTSPLAWKVEEVVTRLGELIKQLEAVEKQKQLLTQISEREADLKDKQQQLHQFEDKAEELRAKLGVMPELNENQLQNYSSLFWYLQDIVKWQNASTQIKAQNNIISGAEDAIKEWLDKLNTVFKKYGLNEIDTYADAKATVHKLDELRNNFDDLNRKIQHAETDKERAQSDKEKAENSLQKICDRLGVTQEDAYVVKELVEKLDSYKTLQQNKGVAEGAVAEAKKALEQHEFFESLKSEIADKAMVEIEAEIENYGQQAQKIEDINSQITAIETRVNDAKKEHDLEKALLKKEEALYELEELYKNNAGSIIGDLLVKQLKSHLGDKNMPEVFNRAKAFFKQITKQRYELLVDSVNDKAEFRAIDLRDGMGRSLEELSTGTRIQLIMSVRLAFIEQAEGEIRLPILADELLANSDSQRAHAIIDALVEISKEGRQIFYFTAQEDEVAKWEFKLQDSPDINHKVYVIGEGEPPKAIEENAFDGIKLHHEVPQPDSVSYDEYGDQLKIPPLVDVFLPIEQLHIWYLLDDADLLYSLLERGIENWGMLRSYFKEDGVIEGLKAPDQNKIKQRADIIEHYLELARQGKSKPINRQVLEDSEAVSDSFINEVSATLEELGNDPQKLLDALQNGQVSGFRSNKKDDLEDYLISEGYINENELLSIEEIQIRISAFISNLDISSKQAQKIVHRLTQN